MLCLFASMHLSIYFLTSTYYSILDYYRVPKCDNSSKYPTIKRYIEVLPNVALNLAANVFMLNNLDIIVANFYNDYHNNIAFYPVGFIICIIWADAWFYITHWYMHYNRFLYKYIHKAHHMYTDPFAFSSFDSNLIEHIVVNVGSVSGGAIIAGYLGLFDKNHTGVWFLLTTYTSCVAHSGYTIKHYLHHKHINYNYGQGIYLLDRVFGTYRST